MERGEFEREEETSECGTAVCSNSNGRSVGRGDREQQETRELSSGIEGKSGGGREKVGEETAETKTLA